PLRNGLFEEQSDHFAFVCQNLLPNDDRLAGLDECPRAMDRVVVGEHDGGDAQLPTSASNLEWGNPAIEGGRAVHVEVHSDPRGPCASDHVRYYRRTGRGLGKIKSGSGAAIDW